MSVARAASVVSRAPPRSASTCWTRLARGAKSSASAAHAAMTQPRQRTRKVAGSANNYLAGMRMTQSLRGWVIKASGGHLGTPLIRLFLLVLILLFLPALHFLSV